MRFALWTLIVSALSACSVSVPKNFNIKKREVPVQVKIITGGVNLGAYAIALIYDASIIHILRIEQGSGEFPGTVLFDDSTFTKGRTTITSYTVTKHVQPIKPPLYHVATVYFTPVRSGTTSVMSEIKTLADPDAKKISGSVRLVPDVIDTR